MSQRDQAVTWSMPQFAYLDSRLILLLRELKTYDPKSNSCIIRGPRCSEPYRIGDFRFEGSMHRQIRSDRNISDPTHPVIKSPVLAGFSAM